MTPRYAVAPRRPSNAGEQYGSQRWTRGGGKWGARLPGVGRVLLTGRRARRRRAGRIGGAERLGLHDWNYGFIVDGFPRNARQAEFFLESYDIDAVILLEIPDEEVIRRVEARRLCSRCGLDYNLIAHQPKVHDVCDVCAGQLVAREDDNPEALAARLHDYHNKTKPIIELFERKEFVARVDATRPTEEVQAEVRRKLALTA